MFDLEDSLVLAGPNNTGKSTLLQGIATWKLGLDRWIAQRKRRGESRAVKRSGVSITRSDFTSVPLREMNHLWEDRRTTVEGKPGRPRKIEIVVEGETGNGDNKKSWVCGLEFEYANAELVYVRPLNAKNLSREEILHFPPSEAEHLAIVHIPPMSGIERDEPRRERGLQDLLIGQGRPGEILRNLLWEIATKAGNRRNWEALSKHIKDLFGITLLSPSYSSAQPYIVCEYRDPDHTRPLDLCNAGSGTLQVLLLLAFLYARPASLMLVDEPDAHQHIILQKRVYATLVRTIAHDRGGQVIVATHSEAILDATDPHRILAFIGASPQRLGSDTDKDQLREALKLVPATQMLLARQVKAVLYVEGPTDTGILAEWARILDHPARKFLDEPYIQELGGRSLRDAKRHFFAIRAVVPEICGICLLDGDNREEPDEEALQSGLKILRWRRYEIENYLLHPDAIKRFVQLPLLGAIVDQHFARQVPAETDFLAYHVSLDRIKASEEFLAPLLDNVGHSTPKRDLYLLARTMKPEEIHSEVVEKLDHIANLLGLENTSG